MPSAPARSVICFLCPACGRVLRAAAPMAGRTSGCPECDSALAVPRVSCESAETVEEAVDPAALARYVARLPARWPGGAVVPNAVPPRTLG